MSDYQIITKITLKNIGAQPKAKTLKEGETVHVANIYGRVRGIEPGSTQYGDFLKFKGAFEAVDIATGQTFRSGTLILPAVLESLISGAFGDQALDFAFKVNATYSEKGNTGYTFTASPLIESTEADELADLRAAAMKALPAPKDEGEGKAKGKGK